MSVSLTSEPPFSHVTRQMTKLMDQLQKGYYGFYSNDTWTPSVNLYETDQQYLVCVDLAGVDKAKIDIEVISHKLTLRGARHVPTMPQPSEGDSKYRVHLMEIDHGSFLREVELPEDVQRDRIQAKYDNGMLWIELPKNKE